MKIILLLTLLCLPIMAKPNFWFQGSVEESFTKARKENKLLFFYWGAVWCPPCNRVKNNIFKKQAFQDAIKNFIPVYLDGDTPRAQTWGEKLKAKGYPTLLVLNSKQEEVSRLDSNLNINEFVSALNSLNKKDDIDVLLRKALASSSLSPKQWKNLSNYSWEQDHHKKLGSSDDKALSSLKKLYIQSQQQVREVKYRFTFLYLGKLAELDKRPGKNEVPSLKKTWLEIFKSKDDLKKQLGSIAYDYSKLRTLLFDKKNLKEEIDLIESFYGNKALSLSQRIYTLLPRALEQAPLARKKLDKLQKKTASISGQTSNPEQYQGTLGTEIYFHYKLQNYQYALKIAKQAVRISSSPFYFMNYVVLVYKGLDKPKEIVQWSKRAWVESKGRSTQIEQGVRYVENLVKFSPKSAPLFKSVAALLEITAKEQDLLDGRGISYFERMGRNISSLPKNQKNLIEQQTRAFCDNRKLDCSKAFKLIF